MTSQPDTQSVPPRNQIEHKLVQIWQQVLGLESIGVRDDFFDLGGSSIQAYQIFSDIGREIGVHLSATTLLEAPTIEQQALLLRSDQARDTECLVMLRSGPKPAWFCVHGRAGGVIFLRDFLPYLDPDRPIYGIQPASREGEIPGYRTVEELAVDYLKEVRAVQPSGPYYLGGSCFGGLVAREMARILYHEQDQQVALLVCIDPPPPGDLSFVRKATRWLLYQVRKRVRRRMHREYPDHIERHRQSIGLDRVELYKRMHGRARLEHRPAVSDVPMVIVGARGTAARHLRIWRPVNPGGVEVKEFPGHHAEMFLPPNAVHVAALVQQAFEKVERSSGRS